MGYNKADGQYADTKDVTLQASVTKTATYTGSAVEVGDRGVGRFLLTVSAASGTTPTLDVLIQTSYDNSTWRSVASFTQATSTTTERLSFSGLDRYVRAKATIGGTTPSFTYSVAGEAV
jgi:hypothetical protein